MSGPGYLHPFLPGVIYANGAGEEIRTVRSLVECSAGEHGLILRRFSACRAQDELLLLLDTVPT
jgi:hypothetical protein